MQSSLGRAVDNMADDFVKAGKEVSRDVSNAVYNPIVSGIIHQYSCAIIAISLISSFFCFVFFLCIM